MRVGRCVNSPNPGPLAVTLDTLQRAQSVGRVGFRPGRASVPIGAQSQRQISHSELSAQRSQIGIARVLRSKDDYPYGGKRLVSVSLSNGRKRNAGGKDSGDIK